MTTELRAPLGFWPARAPDITTAAPRLYDLRKDERKAEGGYAPWGIEPVETEIRDAREAIGVGLETTGFDLIRAPSAVQDFYAVDAVMKTYYAECRNLAMHLTGASHAFTFDHLIREPGRQISGGGTDGQPVVTGAEAGGGYVGAVHVDYTANTTWHQYLAVHGVRLPDRIRRTISLNFWRPLGSIVRDQPLAVCDARTVEAKDLFETIVIGYGASNYSWHELGIETYNVKASPAQRWYYYPGMAPDEVLVFKSFDSLGTIGRACPHAAFRVPGVVSGSPRRSIELRVLCFVTDPDV
jgi:hypothetical protein